MPPAIIALMGLLPAKLDGGGVGVEVGTEVATVAQYRTMYL